MSTTENSAAHKIRSLLRLAHGAVMVGSMGEAKAASAAARSTAFAADLPRIYVEYPKGCPLVRERMFMEIALVPDWLMPTPADAWRKHVTYVSEHFEHVPDPAEHVLVGYIASGAINKHGAHVLIPDWTDVHEAADVAQRALGEGQ